MSTILKLRALGLMLLLLGERIVEPNTLAHYALSGLQSGLHPLLSYPNMAQRL